MQELFQETTFLRGRRAFPWLHLLRVPRIAMHMQILLAGFIASFLLMSSEILLTARQSTNIPTYATQLPTLQEMISHPLETLRLVAAPNVAIFETSYQLVNQGAGNETLISGFALLLHLFAGLIICRMACAEFTQGVAVCLERSSIFAVKKLPAVFTGILFPLLLIALLYGISAACLVTENIPVVGPWLGGILYGLSIPLLFFTIVVSLGLIVGWPLIVTVIACENSDSFDAWSRSFDYLRSRLITILLAFVITMALGTFALGCVAEISQATFGWLDTLQSNILGQPLETIQLRSDATFGQGAVGFQQLWKTLWGNLLDGYLIALYWCTVSAIYVLTRHSVDRVPINEFQQS